MVSELLTSEILRLSQEKFPLLKNILELYAISAAISTPESPAPTTTMCVSSHFFASSLIFLNN